MASEYIRTISSTDTAPGIFDEDFRERMSGLVQHLSGDEDLQGFNAGRDMVEPPSHQKVAYAVKTIMSKMHKSPEVDDIYNRMLVLGGEPVRRARHALYGRIWATREIPPGWGKLGSHTCIRRGVRQRSLTAGSSPSCQLWQRPSPSPG